MALFDTHAHLSDAQFSADREAVLDRAAAKGVATIVEIADAPAEWDAALALSRARPLQVRCSLGLHPYYADQLTDALVEKLAEAVKLPEVVAVGEIGLDYVKAEVGRDVQLATFKRLLGVCKGWDKPVVIHCRGANEDLRAILAEHFHAPRPTGGFWGVIHCFSGSTDDALFYRDLGFALGADGPVTYPKNDELREALRQAGLDCLVLETDSPYLPPQSSRGKRNEPGLLPEIAERLARVFEIPIEELASRTARNGKKLFRL